MGHVDSAYRFVAQRKRLGQIKIKIAAPPQSENIQSARPSRREEASSNLIVVVPAFTRLTFREFRIAELTPLIIRRLGQYSLRQISCNEVGAVLSSS